MYPCANTELTDLVVKLQKVFYATAKLREIGKVSNQSFEKLYEKPVLKNLDLKKVDLSLLMQSVTQNAKSIDFLQFCELMHHLWKQKVLP